MRRHAKASFAGSIQAAGFSRSLIRAFLAACALSVVLAGSASASQKHVHIGAFGSFGQAGSVVVDQVGGDVYVLDRGISVPAYKDKSGNVVPAVEIAPAIRKFDSAGNPVAFSALAGSNAINGSDAGADADQTPANGFSLDAGSQIALDPAGNIYLADAFNNVVDVFAPSGAYLDQLDGTGSNPGNPTEKWSDSFAVPCGLAFDPAGNLYVSTSFSGTINRYTPAGSPVEDGDFDARIDGLPFGTCGLAADSAGAVYNIPSGSGSAGVLTKYTAADFGTTAPAGTEIDPNATAVAVNPANDHVFAGRQSSVQEYDAAGAVVSSPFGGEQLSDSHGVAVHSGTGNIYASNVLGPDSPDPDKDVAVPTPDVVHAFTPLVTVPDVVTGTPSAVTETSATVHGTVDPDGVALGDCQFEYIDDAAFQANILDEPNHGHPAVDGFTGAGQIACVPDAASVPTGSGDAPVSADLTGLDPGTAYHVRLVATNANDVVRGGGTTFSTKGSPVVQTLYAGPLSVSTATLAGRVNPRNQAGLSYQFEWGTTESYGNVAPASPQPLGASDGTFHVVTAPLAGLSPDTTYHFHLIVSGGPFGTIESSDHAFTTAPASPSMPGRGYEMVSPLAKNGNDVITRDKRVVAFDGSRALFSTFGTSPGAAGGDFTTFISRRDPASGWASAPVELPTAGGVTKYFASSDDLTRSVVQAPSALTPDAISGANQLYLRDNDNGNYQLLTPENNGPQNFGGPSFQYAGASADFTHIVYGTEPGLAPQTLDPVSSAFNPYEWVEGQGVRLVGILPDGSIPVNGSIVGSNSDDGTIEHAISADGNRIFFHTIDGGIATSEEPQNSAAGQLYARVNGASTIHVSASQRTDCAGDPSCGGDNQADPAHDPMGPLPALFWNAESQHGDKVLFSSCEKLTDDSTAQLFKQPGGGCGYGSAVLSLADGGNGGGSELYLYDLESGELTDVSAGDPNGSNLMGVIGASEDLSRIYFVAEGVLDEGATRGEANVYLWRDGSINFIASLENEVNGANTRTSEGDLFTEDKSNWGINPNSFEYKTATTRVTPDGEHLVLTTRLPLTGFDNRSPSCPPLTAQHPLNLESRCAEVYIYDAGAKEMSCVSCPGDGVPAAGNARLVARPFTGLLQPAALPDPVMTRNVSDDGSFVFFESHDPLVQADSNGQIDVYQWHEGTVSLISSGKSSSRSRFVDATPDGSNVFFLTTERLSSSDQGSNVDLYNARIGGGFPEPPPPPPPCNGDACLSPPQVPNDPTPASSAFAGAGNVRPAPPASRKACKKHQKRKNGKCVVRKKKAGNARGSGTTGRAGK